MGYIYIMKGFLWVIILFVVGSTKAIAQQSMACRMLASFVEKDGIFDWSRESNNVILIDTFQFFNSSCSGIYGNKTITILYKKPDSFKNDNNVFFLAGIATGRQEALALAILHSRSNHVIAHYFSIFGIDIQVIKKSSGDF